MEDSQIVDLYLARNEQAITESAAQYGSRLRTIANRITGDPLTAEECENDTYLRAWNLIPPHEPRNYLLPFLARIVRFCAIDALKRGKARRRDAEFLALTEEIADCIPSDLDVETAVDAKELSRLISAFLHELSPDKRIMFLRRYYFMDTIADIAERLGIAPGTIRTGLHRTRTALKEYLKKEHYL